MRRTNGRVGRLRQRGFTLLTANAKDYKDVPGLKFVALKVA